MSKFLLVLVAVLALSFSTFAQKKNQGKELRDAVDRVDKASEVMDEIMKIADKSIPRDLLAKANAIVVFPGAVKGAFIVGRRAARASR